MKTETVRDESRAIMRQEELFMRWNCAVWDWNGTLFDDVDICIYSINELLARHGLKRLDAKKYREIFGFPVKDYYKRAGFDFSLISFDELAKEYMEIYQPLSDSCRLRRGAQETVDALKKEGIESVILSASRTDYLLRQMKNTEIRGISAVYGTDDILAGGKAGLAQRLRRDRPDGKFLFIGDAPHDAEAAEAAGADCILLAGGHKQAEQLKRYAPVLSEICSIPGWIQSKNDMSEE